MTARIVLFGATGYTGARTAEALVAAGASPVLAGRNPAKLTALAQRLGGVETAQADVTDPASVRGLLSRGDVLVTTVGPFLQLGRAAVDAAVDAGAVYLDSTGEPPFVRRVFEEDGRRAAETGAALIPAFGLDYVPGNLAAAMALAEAGEQAHRVDVGYSMSGVSGQAFSRGTLVSLMGVLLEPGFAFTGGRLTTEGAGRRVWEFQVDGRTRRGLSVGGSEHLTLPGLAPTLREVGVHLDWFGPLTGPAHLLSPLMGLAARVPGAAGGAQRVADLVGKRVGEAPSEATVARARTHTVAEVRDRAGELVSRVQLDGPEAYGLTASLLAFGAGRAAAGGVRGTGALGPVQAFGLDELTAGAATAGLVRG
ncbi:saccharopine dehydrogenase NADP-binding domain-containing protein [Blastococcus sp. TF02A-30]|uniref:saccharopine dehydrogenase NADP-binding domain-containing protein n=1 Tax=Blastococcus sp. TF02A-30 TaxID=2250580 RepID=UPI000DEA8CD4|nr:saccharopine dehydrogenase NADP-binding domain-containing protein [Blastococcus sp. TF02A-30]RBY84064.1 saccharopine dehydrogenase [Blastococcus sp. TF02A-30]